MFGPVTTVEAHVAFAGASHHTNNTAELSGITESLHFLCLAARFPRSSRVCIFHDTRHAADVCLGSVQSLTNVRLGLTSQSHLLPVQLRSFLTLRHICSHGRERG